jgi:MGT family glycosyltransferase
MSRVLAYTSPARGHVYPLTAVLLALRDRGHDVSVCTLASQVPMLRGLGLDAHAIDPAIEALPLDDWQARTTLGALRRGMAMFGRRAPLDAADLQAAVDQHQPDLVLVDVNSWGAIAAAEAWGGPWAVFCPYPLPLSSRDVPPFGPGFAPASTAGARLRDGVVGRIGGTVMDRAVATPVNVVRRDLGLAPVRGVDDMVLRMPLLLALTAEPFEYPRSDWPSSVRLVGPCDWDPPVDPPPWLDDLTGPVVLVTSSSEFQDDGRLVQATLDALADEPVTVVATVPSARRPDRVPSNARVETFVPHGAVLDRAAVAVTHGGMGATQKALAHGVPVVVVPFGRDQAEVARRAEVAGAGVRLPASRLSPARLRDAVRRASVLADGARRVATGYAAAGGPTAAADALESLVVTSR